MLFKHKDQFLSNSQVHKINTRQTFDLYVPTADLTVYQKGVYYSGTKIYNHLPTSIKDLSDDNKFKLAVKRYLLHNSFYSLEEYFNNSNFIHIITYTYFNHSNLIVNAAIL